MFLLIISRRNKSDQWFDSHRPQDCEKYSRQGGVGKFHLSIRLQASLCFLSLSLFLTFFYSLHFPWKNNGNQSSTERRRQGISLSLEVDHFFSSRSQQRWKSRSLTRAMICIEWWDHGEHACKASPFTRWIGKVLGSREIFAFNVHFTCIRWCVFLALKTK